MSDKKILPTLNVICLIARWLLWYVYLKLAIFYTFFILKKVKCSNSTIVLNIETWPKVFPVGAIQIGARQNHFPEKLEAFLYIRWRYLVKGLPTRK